MGIKKGLASWLLVRSSVLAFPIQPSTWDITKLELWIDLLGGGGF